MRNKFNQWMNKKAEQWGDKKFIFVFVKLPYILLSLYCVVVSVIAIWSVRKNIDVAQDFIKLEESYERLKQSYQQRERRQTEYCRQQIQQLQQQYQKGNF